MGGMPSQVKTIEEVTSKVLADRLKTKLDGDQEDTAKLFYAPIVKVLKEQLALMKPGTGQQYASKGAGANPASWTPGAILDGEANQVASANLPGEAVGISVASASRVDRGWDASGNI